MPGDSYNIAACYDIITFSSTKSSSPPHLSPFHFVAAPHPAIPSFDLVYLVLDEHLHMMPFYSVYVVASVGT
jgi:hypothetical protein